MAKLLRSIVAPQPDGIGDRRKRLQNVSKTEVETREFEWTEV